MDKRKGILNVSVSIGFKFITMIAAIFLKRLLIENCGNDINGLNALYLSIIGFLSVVELGVGSAITFCMYKPIVEGDNDTVSALYHLFRRIYIIIGCVIFAGGLAIVPFLKFLAKDYEQVDVDLGFTFVLMLVSVFITYFFSCKTSLINAYKNNYITTSISYGGILLQYIMQIVVLIITKSFVWYLVCRIVATALQWIVTEIIARNKYSNVIKNIKKLGGTEKKELVKNIKAMFMHRIGYILVNTVDSIVISTFVGVVALGEYSNYTMILTSMAEVLKIGFTSLTSVIGHLYVEASKKTTQRYCEAFHLLNFVLGVVFFLGYYAIIDNLIAIMFSADLVVSKSVSIVITMNGFVQFMRQSAMLFREATGTFYNDRWKPLFEGGLNIILSVIFVQWFGVAGVIVATIITNLLICHVVEPYVLYKNAFAASPKNYYLKNYGMILLFGFSIVVLAFCMQDFDNQWIELLVNGIISVGISLCACLVVFLLNRKLGVEILGKLKASMKKFKAKLSVK